MVQNKEDKTEAGMPSFYLLLVTLHTFASPSAFQQKQLPSAYL
jgi:hypothetical protein